MAGIERLEPLLAAGQAVVQVKRVRWIPAPVECVSIALARSKRRIVATRIVEVAVLFIDRGACPARRNCSAAAATSRTAMEAFADVPCPILGRY